MMCVLEDILNTREIILLDIPWDEPSAPNGRRDGGKPTTETIT